MVESPVEPDILKKNSSQFHPDLCVRYSPKSHPDPQNVKFQSPVPLGCSSSRHRVFPSPSCHLLCLLLACEAFLVSYKSTFGFSCHAQSTNKLQAVEELRAVFSTQGMPSISGECPRKPHMLYLLNIDSNRTLCANVITSLQLYHRT